MSRLRDAALGIQAAYYVTSGLWPIFSMRTFEAVTGPKFDRWLVKMVGLLAATNGATIGLAVARKRQDEAETIALSVMSALAFTTIDVVYAAKGRISPIYVADAVVELALIVAVLLPSES